MPLLARPDGAEIWWDETGEGPGVLICNMFNLTAPDALVERLAAERRVVTYEQRGLGRSTRGGPYDLDTGVADVEALLEETGPVEVAFGMGDGAHRAMRLADARPDLVDRVVITSTALGRSSDTGETAGFSGSRQVLSALMSLLRRDYRSGLRSMVMSSGSFDDEVKARDRVEALANAVPQDGAVGYLEAWIEAGSVDVARRLGGRLTVVAYGGNDWFPLAMFEDMREFLTEACFEVAEDGPVNRPDLAAAILLRVSEPAKG